AGRITAHEYADQLAEAEQAGVISAEEHALLKRVAGARAEFIAVDDFAPEELRAAAVRDKSRPRDLHVAWVRRGTRDVVAVAVRDAQPRLCPAPHGVLEVVRVAGHVASGRLCHARGDADTQSAPDLRVPGCGRPVLLPSRRVAAHASG